MKHKPKILIATEILVDAEMVRKLLHTEFEQIEISTDPDKAVEDIEKYCPNILILAFNTLEKAERYYLGLYRLSTLIHRMPHRTLILCNKEDMRRVYELCKREYFDDYIFFWPIPSDILRLLMAVHIALRQINNDHGPATAEITKQTKRLAELELMLETYAATGHKNIELTSHSVQQAESDILGALDRFYAKLTQGDYPELTSIRDQAAFKNAILNLRKEEIEKHFKSVTAAVQPMRKWADALKDKLAPQLESIRALQAITKQLTPVILVVDDDDFQHKLLTQMLAEENWELMFATSGAGAIGAIHRRRPDLILMDIHLPGIDGLEVTRRIKSIELFASIPIIMITGQSDKGIVVESLKAGAADFVVKPFNKNILLTKLRKLLQGEST